MRRHRAILGPLTATLSHAGPIHVCLLLGIGLGVFQGYLKDRIAHPAIYFASDLFFGLAFLLWLGWVAAKRQPIRMPPSVGVALLIVIGIPTLYTLYPGTPALVRLSGFRGWVEYPLALLIALTTLREGRQLYTYAGLIIALATVTGLYGIWQYRAGADAVLSSALGAARHGETVFYAVGAEARPEFRAISTFVFPGPFAMFMVFGILLTCGLILGGRTRPWLVAIGLLLTIPMAVGMAVSGTRAALVILGVGLVALARFRRTMGRAVAVTAVLVLALHLSTRLTERALLGRFASLAPGEGKLWSYAMGPLTTAAREIVAHPFGGGLGRTGAAVPFFIRQQFPDHVFVFSDGDLGRAAAEMGVLGVAGVMGAMFFLVIYAYRLAREASHGAHAALAAGIGALLVSQSVGMLIGSPFVSIPHGLIWWFFFGALVVLRRESSPPAEAQATV